METLLSKAEIPIIDLSYMSTTMAAPCKTSLRRVAAQLHRALSEKGLALLVNHGIPDDKIRAVYEAMDKFCDLPHEDTHKYIRKPPDNHGYVPSGLEKFSEDKDLQEVRHTFNVVRLDGQLPDAEVPGFQAAVTSLAQDFRRLALLLLRALAVALELSPDFFLSNHSSMWKPGNESCMRLLDYPPFTAPPKPGVMRCGEHADYGTFSLLTQDCEGGLEVLIGGKWGRVGHLPGSILINAGELLATWTRNKYPALRHRVIVPENEAAYCKGRHSIAFFVHPDNDTPIAPLSSPVLEEQAAEPPQPPASPTKHHSKHGSIYTAYQHLQMRFRETYAS
ncbi:uncharacterized protein LOC134531006 [Bacillus rossius redtenbacheri]|uniref:uncharacterized protein LOC134531006 n=1 Tax=Bacillus rossius redtenbacheri TaxID=93214 RepID=UPI002FDDBD11